MATQSYTRSFNRFEFKYVITSEAARAFREALEGYTFLDPNADPERGYPVFSIYWESANLDFFWEKLEGLKYRRKLRFRRYAGSEEAFVEIKQRIDRTVQKRRVRWPLARIQRVFDWDGCGAQTLPEDDAASADPVASEALFLCRHYGLRPMMAVDYRRQALFGIYESDLRITFDSRLQYSAGQLELERPFTAGRMLLDPNLVVLEIKFNNRVPLWLCKLTQRHGLKLVRLSKYCLAVDREFFQGRYS